MLRLSHLQGGDAQTIMASKEVSREKIVKELAAIGFARVTDYMQIEDGELKIKEKLRSAQGAAIASIERSPAGIKVKFYDKMKALELLGKHLGLFESKESRCDSGDNNLLEAIIQATQEALETNDIPELQQTAAAGNDLVESAGV